MVVHQLNLLEWFEWCLNLGRVLFMYDGMHQHSWYDGMIHQHQQLLINFNPPQPVSIVRWHYWPIFTIVNVTNHSQSCLIIHRPATKCRKLCPCLGISMVGTAPPTSKKGFSNRKPLQFWNPSWGMHGTEFLSRSERWQSNDRQPSNHSIGHSMTLKVTTLTVTLVIAGLSSSRHW